MDGVISPVPTTDPSSGAVEALTVTPAFFEYQGWLGAGAYGRRGGATLAQEFVTVAATKPTYLVFNQVCPVVVRETNPPSFNAFVGSQVISASARIQPYFLFRPVLVMCSPPLWSAVERV